MALYDHEGTRGLAPLSILGQPPGKPGNQVAEKREAGKLGEQLFTRPIVLSRGLKNRAF